MHLVSPLLFTPNPCPNCGSINITSRQQIEDVSFSWEQHKQLMCAGYTISCDDCPCTTRLHRTSHKLVLQAWNRGEVMLLNG